jgi:hypothetical protein
MDVESSVTETIVRNHLQAFLEQKGVAAIVSDYHENARFYSEAKITAESRRSTPSSRTSSTLCLRAPSSTSHSEVCGSTETSPISPGAWAAISLWARTRSSSATG